MDVGEETVVSSENNISEDNSLLVIFIKASVVVVGVCLSLFHLYTGGFGVLDAYLQRTIHLMTLIMLAFLTFPTNNRWSAKKNALIDVPLACTALIIGIYLVVHHDRIVGREWYYGPITTTDITFGIITIILTLEAARRVVGLALPIIAIFFMFYAFYGSYFPYPFTIRSAPPLVFIDHMFLTPQAIFGVPVGVSATFVYLFILFGAFLETTKGGQFIIDFSMSLVGRATGGPAKVAVVASSLFGTVSGHSVANVYGTGTFTIPLMKRAGYNKEFAGAVEAASSCGGQLMPPIMGAAAFIIAEIIGIPYLEVCKAAILPALLYYIAVFASTHIEALKKGLRGLDKDEVPQLLPTLSRGYHFTIPIILLVIVLVKGFTPFRAAFIAIIALIVVSMFRKESRLTPRSFVDTLVLGAKNSIVIAASCGCAGIVVGVLDVTGLGIKFVTIVTELSGGLLPVALVMVMISCLVLGMGVPTAPAYIIAAMIAAPTLIHFGLQPIVAHMFIFYSALLSAITPPVALAAYAAAAISGGRVMVTGVIASRLGIVVFLVPYIFVYNAALLMIGSPLFVMWAFLTGVIGTLNLVFALGGYLFSRLNWWQRTIFLIAGLCTIVPEIATDIIGLGLFVVFAWLHYRESREVATVS